MSRYQRINQEIASYASPVQAKILQRFFKTGKGEYGEGDVFLGLKMGDVRRVAKKNRELPLAEVQKLVASKFHEHRMAGLIIVLLKFQKADVGEQKKLFDFYLKNTRYINNWDLVDVTCPGIVGEYLRDKPRTVLYRLAQSQSLWEKRIAMLATLAFIRQGDLDDAFRLAKIFLPEEHDLMHKASGWMLREAGKKDPARLRKFLKQHVKKMPRTMLRYAIEKFPESERQRWLAK